MDDVRLDRPVRVALGRAGNVIYTARTVGDAADILLHRWPKQEPGAKHLAARKACLSALERLKEARHAREAFEAAAEEADILMPPEPPKATIPESVGPTLWNKRKRKLKRDM